MSAAYQEALGRSAVHELVSLAFLYPVPGALDLLKDCVRRAEQAASDMGPPELIDVLNQLPNDLAPVDEVALNKNTSRFSVTQLPVTVRFMKRSTREPKFSRSRAPWLT